jgi:hypothetical protein
VIAQTAHERAKLARFSHFCETCRPQKPSILVSALLPSPGGLTSLRQKKFPGNPNAMASQLDQTAQRARAARGSARSVKVTSYVNQQLEKTRRQVKTTDLMGVR